MKEEVIKIPFKSYLFEMNFYTEFSGSFTVTDVCDGRVYQNKNVEFNKIQKSSVIKALQQKSKEISCKINEKLIEDQMNRSSDQLKVKEKRCMQIQFLVNSEFIVPFSQKILLYEIQSEKKSQKILPKQVSSKTADEVKKSIDQIDKTLSSINQEEDEIKVYQIPVMPMINKNNQQEFVYKVMLAYGVALFILWFTYLEFVQFLVLLAIGALVAFYYFSTQKYLLTKIQLQEGFYKIDITGTISLTSYNTNQTCGVYLFAGFNSWHRQKLKLHFYSIYSYAAPFSGTFIIESKKPQQLTLQVQKNKIQTINVNNVIVTSQRLPLLTNFK